MILWGRDHEARGRALADACHELCSATASLPRGSEGIAALSSRDTTLTVWGHGDANAFSEMADEEFAILVKNWKNKNPILSTVEIVTCDARHSNDGLSGYATRVATLLTRARCGGVILKGLPIGQRADDNSILWANAPTATFCYITSPSSATAARANRRLHDLEGSLASDLNQVAQQMARERGPAPNNFTVTGGNFRLLRSYLSIIQ